MGVTFLQHRIVTGLYSNIRPKSKGELNGKFTFTFTKKEVLNILYGGICVIYIYLICLLLAGAVEVAPITEHKFHRSYNIGLNHTVVTDCNSLLNSATMIVLMTVYSRLRNGTAAWIFKYSSPHRYSSAKCSRTHFLCNMLTIWTTVLNLVLLVFCNTSILNPGPDENRRTHLKVMFRI